MEKQNKTTELRKLRENARKGNTQPYLQYWEKKSVESYRYTMGIKINLKIKEWIYSESNKHKKTPSEIIRNLILKEMDKK